MNYLKERVAYLKGLAEGMNISDSGNEGKLLKAIIDVLDDIALAVEDVEEVQEQLSEQIENIDEDLAEIESVVLGDDDCECDCGECDDEEVFFKEFECPYCNEKIAIDEDIIDDDGETIECPSCHKKIEIDWECDCEDCDE